jgi:outer membrane lipopolysaccharide assembly protein LptE/RlpB
MRKKTDTRTGNQRKQQKQNTIQKVLHVMSLVLMFGVYFFVVSCGYHMVGSKHLNFNSVTIEPILNQTYEPKLEESLHKALSEEFISQGIKVLAHNGDASIKTVIKTFELGSLASIDENVQEQTIIMKVDVRIIDRERIIEFISMESPIKITFQTTGAVIDSVSQKERAIDKASSEIAGEIVGKMILRYAE